MIQHLYAIKRGKEFIQRQRSSRLRGGSWMQPVNPRYEYPRVFPALRHARIYLTIWLKGGIPCERDYGDVTYPGEPIPDPTRRREDMEIAMLRLHPYEGGDTDFKVMYFLECNGKWLTDKTIAYNHMGEEAREFEEECIYNAQFFKSELAARRYLIKWRRGPSPAMPWNYFGLLPDGKEKEKLDDMLFRRKEMNIRIVPYVYVECK